LNSSFEKNENENVASIQNKCETRDNVAVDFKPNVCGDKCILEKH